MSTTANARKDALEDELERYISILAEHEKPEKIIVFGSMASGDVHEWSDIDLIIVKETDLPFYQRLRSIRNLLQPKIGVDILYYTPEEFEYLVHNRLFFQQEVLPKGKVLYERGK
jgi:predicted nucleotidyltransferase